MGIDYLGVFVRNDLESEPAVPEVIADRNELFDVGTFVQVHPNPNPNPNPNPDPNPNPNPNPN